jgi:hypothetical protein
MKNKHCSWCDNSFKTKISYQIYCSPACRDAATREKIAARYQLQRRKRRVEKPRLCKSCNRKLSSYNDDNICDLCPSDPTEVAKILRDIKGLMNGKDQG